MGGFAQKEPSAAGTATAEPGHNDSGGTGKSHAAS